MTQLDGKSMNIIEQNIEKLKEIFPEVFSEGKIDFSKLEEELGNFKEDENERYNFTWNGKSEAKKIALTPSTGTLRPCKVESKDWDTTQNLYIEGDNLEVLKLLQKSYHKKVKMIYIDPPYNTGKDFVYKDNFRDNIKNYLEITGQVDSDGNKFSTNSETSGRYHSDWLNMMYPRLKLARNLLKDDGVIFISIDDNEVANLRKLCDEIFGEDNFITDIVWKKRVSPANDAQWYSSDHEFLLIYAKNKSNWFPNKTLRTSEHDKYYKNTDNDPRGAWNSAAYTCNKSRSERPNLYYAIVNPFTSEEIFPSETAVWAYSKETHEEHVKNNLLYWGADGQSKAPRKKQFLSEAKPIVPRTIWDYSEVGSTQTATLEVKDLFEGSSFSYPKATGVIKKAIYQGTTEDDLILDFFSGSATTAQALFQLNVEDGGSRKFICVQIPESTDEKSEAFKAGYKNICEIGKERIRRAGEKVKTKSGKDDLDIGFKVLKLDSSNIKSWDSDFENLEINLLEAIENIKADRNEEDLLYEILLKYGLDLTLPIDKPFENKNIYNIGFGALIICLDNNISIDITDEIIAIKKEYDSEITRVVFKDSGFTNATEKTNIIKTLNQNGIDEVVSV
jgi:adenine-specific DNA-methyltransferase